MASKRETSSLAKPEEELRALKERQRAMLREGMSRIKTLEAPAGTAKDVKDWVAAEYENFGANQPEFDER